MHIKSLHSSLSHFIRFHLCAAGARSLSSTLAGRHFVGISLKTAAISACKRKSWRCGKAGASARIPTTTISRYAIWNCRSQIIKHWHLLKVSLCIKCKINFPWVCSLVRFTTAPHRLLRSQRMKHNTLEMCTRHPHQRRTHTHTAPDTHGGCKSGEWNNINNSTGIAAVVWMP